jgi:hypothetical protein
MEVLWRETAVNTAVAGDDNGLVYLQADRVERSAAGRRPLRRHVRR